jgi:CRP-like cAMP-binding protein
VRYKVLRGLGRLVAETRVKVDRARIDAQIRHNLIEHVRVLAIRIALDRDRIERGERSLRLVLALLDAKHQQSLERAFRLLGIRHKNEDIRGVFFALRSRERRTRAHALEFLDVLTTTHAGDAVGREVRELFLVVADDLTPAERVARASRFLPARPMTHAEALTSLIADEDESLAAFAAYHALEYGTTELEHEVASALTGVRGSTAAPARNPCFRRRSRSAMPPDAREPRSAVEREIFLRTMTVGRPMSPTAKLLGEAMREVFIEAGAVLYEEGSAADDLYFIMQGSVALRREGDQDLVFGPNSVVGIIDADLDRPHARRAVALTDVEALALRTEDRLEVLEDNFEQTRALILFSADMLHELTLRLPAEDSSPLPDPGPELGPEPLPLVERVLLLHDTLAFKRGGIQALVSLAPVADEFRIRAGDTLFRAGEVTGVFFVVARGTIELEHESSKRRFRFGPGAIVGGSAAFGDAERLYTARALCDSVLLRLREEAFFDVMEDHFDLARSVLGYIAQERERVVDELEKRKRATEQAAE